MTKEERLAIQNGKGCKRFVINNKSDNRTENTSIAL